MPYDVVIVGGGPAGLSAALALGRARRRVLLCDSTPARNAAAARIQNFVTRDGTPPAEFRRTAREQLAPYTTVEIVDEHVESVAGERSRFEVRTSARAVEARRILLCVGVIDVLPDLPGYRELWGKAIFQCPYCHAWEIRDRAFGLIAPGVEHLEWSLFLQSWSRDLVVFTDGRFDVPSDIRQRLTSRGVRLEERRIRRLVTSADDGDHGAGLAAIELESGDHVPREFLFARPPQRQSGLVTALGLELDPKGFVTVSDHCETSRPGIFAAGDMTTPMQGAVLAAAAGTRAAAMLTHGLMMELADVAT